MMAVALALDSGDAPFVVARVAILDWRSARELVRAK